MKHIKKKFLNQLTKDEFENYKNNNSFKTFSKDENFEEFKKLKTTSDTTGILQTTKGVFITSFIHKIKGIPYVFPEPDPTIIYFSSAQRFRRQINESQKKLLETVRFDIENVDDDIAESFYNYYESVCGTIIFLFISLESFANDIIPKDSVYKKEMTSKTETFNHRQIQEYLSFGDKIKYALPQLTGKDFFKQHPLKAQTIYQLKEFRDSIVHTKSEDKKIKHDYIVRKSFSFNFDKAIEHCADFMNYYRPNYIVECNCGKDF